MMNKSGPRIDPSGTPVLTGRRLDLMLFICTNCCLSDKTRFDVVYLYKLLPIRQVTI